MRGGVAQQIARYPLHFTELAKRVAPHSEEAVLLTQAVPSLCERTTSAPVVIATAFGGLAAAQASEAVHKLCTEVNEKRKTAEEALEARALGPAAPEHRSSPWFLRVHAVAARCRCCSARS